MKMAVKLLMAVSVFALVFSGVCRAQHGDQGGGRGSRGDHGDRSGQDQTWQKDDSGGQSLWRGRDVLKTRSISVSEPARFQSQSDIVRDNRHVAEPKKFGSGEAIRAHHATNPPQDHNAVMGNQEVLRDISGGRGSEKTRNHFYWHENGGVRYAHYYDDHDVHWYGFYHGPNFYWTRYYMGRWWWYDPTFVRWTFWWDGYWWWMGPSGYFVYVNNSYYPYQSGAVTVTSTETMPTPDISPTPAIGKGFDSPDGRRMVKIMGSQSEAFLYDKSGSMPVYMTYLGRGVDKIRFSEGKPGEPAQILVDFQDGSFALFDMDGKPAKAAAVPPEIQAPPSGDSVPPLPASAPGQ